MIIKCGNEKENEIVFIDPEDYERLKHFKWTILRQKRDGYIIRYVTRKEYSNKDWSTSKIFYMHREIMQPPQGMVVDHKNGNGLDNQKTNLRIVTISENSKNRNNFKKDANIKEIETKYHGIRFRAKLRHTSKVFNTRLEAEKWIEENS